MLLRAVKVRATGSGMTHGISKDQVALLRRAGLGIRRGGRRYSSISGDAKLIIGMSARDTAEDRGYNFYRTTKTAQQFNKYIGVR